MPIKKNEALDEKKGREERYFDFFYFFSHFKTNSYQDDLYDSSIVVCSPQIC